MAKTKSTFLSTQESQFYTDNDLELFYLNARDNVVANYVQSLIEIFTVLPQNHPKIQAILNQWSNRISNMTGIQDIIDWCHKRLDYYHVIKTQKDLETQFERCKKIVYYQGLELPILLIFDYQLVDERSLIGSGPTFYSYFDSKAITNWGTGAYYIAFPSTAAYLTDDELMVAMKHEFGHIVQGHCSVHSNDPFDRNYMNQSMDISINLGMTEKEQELLISVAQKLFGQGAYPCMSLIAAHGQGGFGIPQLVSVGDWQTPHDFIKLYYKRKNDEEQKGPPQQGEGQGQGGKGKGGAGEGDPQKIDEKIKEGDFVILRGSDPKVYGQVTAINETTGEVVYDEISQEDWEQIKKKM